MSIFMGKEEREEVNFYGQTPIVYEDAEVLNSPGAQQKKETGEGIHSSISGAGEINFFAEKPIIEITKVDNVKKNLFTSMRVFTISVNSGEAIVKRSREDFKWLVKYLRSEFPNTLIDPIHKGDLSKKSIDLFFDNLLSRITINKSRYLLYFLTSQDSQFYTRRERDLNWIKNLKDKFKDTDKIRQDLKKHVTPLTKDMIDKFDEEQSISLEVFLDEFQEVERKNQKSYREIIKASDELQKTFDQASKLINKIGKEIGNVSQNRQFLEKKAPEMFPNSSLSDNYSLLKMSFFIWSSEIAKIPSVISSHLTALIKSISFSSSSLTPIFELRDYLTSSLTSLQSPLLNPLPSVVLI